MNWVVTRHRNERAKPNANWKKHLCSRLQPNFPTCQSGKLDLKNKKLVWTSGLKKGQSITVWEATLYSGIVLTVWSPEKETTTTTKKHKHKIANFWKQCRSWWLVTNSLQNLQVRGVTKGVLGCPWPPPPPLVGLLLSKQPTIFSWRKHHDNSLTVKATVEKPTSLKFVFLCSIFVNGSCL